MPISAPSGAAPTKRSRSYAAPTAPRSLPCMTSMEI
jgi:hypothetical protein